MDLLHAIEDAANKTYTENGAVTLETTGDCCLDLFATVGALRHVSEEEICLFARDVRGGLGERRAFRVITRWLADYAHTSVAKNISNIPEYGRYDDLLSLLATSCEADVLRFIAAQWKKDMKALESGEPVSLLGKWLPSVNATNADTIAKGKKVAKYLKLRPVEYRKALTALRKRIHILENDLRIKEYNFDYAKLPSKAMYKYRAAFLRNDEARYHEFLNKVEKGEAQMHTDSLTPYDIVASVLDNSSRWKPDVKAANAKERKALDVTWKALPDYTCGENALVVVDGSGSMYGYGNPMPAAVALSLGIYFAERNRGQFQNHFITFSEHPRLVKIKGNDIVDKVMYCESYNECANTNIEAVFRLILTAAKIHQVPQEEMPSRIYIVSDMEFDYCAENASLTPATGHEKSAGRGPGQRVHAASLRDAGRGQPVSLRLHDGHPEPGPVQGHRGIKSPGADRI